MHFSLGAAHTLKEGVGARKHFARSLRRVWVLREAVCRCCAPLGGVTAGPGLGWISAAASWDPLQTSAMPGVRILPISLLHPLPRPHSAPAKWH